MAINVQYAPTASSMGGVAYLGGYGEYANNERRYQDQIAMRTQELLQRERMQAMQLQSSAANQVRQNQTALQQQLLGQLGRERLAVFGHQSGIQDRALQFEMQSRLGQQQIQQRDWLDEQQMNRRADMEARVQAERAEHAQREAEARAQQINQDAQRRIEAARKQMVAGQIRPGDFQAFEQRMLDEASQQLAGVEWETQMPQGRTPKEELEQTWHDQHVKVDGQPMVMSPDGKWYVPTNYKKAEVETAPQGPTPQQIDAAKAQNKLYDDFESAVRKRTDELGRDDGISEPLFPKLQGRARSEAIRKMAIEYELGRFGLTEVPKRHEGFESSAPARGGSNPLVPSWDNVPLNGVDPEFQKGAEDSEVSPAGQMSVPPDLTAAGFGTGRDPLVDELGGYDDSTNPARLAVEQYGYDPAKWPPEVVVDVSAFAWNSPTEAERFLGEDTLEAVKAETKSDRVMTNQRFLAHFEDVRQRVASQTLEDGRKPVRSMRDLLLPDGTTGRPPDLTGAELAQLGSDVVGGQVAKDLNKPDVMSTLPPASQKLIRELDQVANSEIGIGTSARPVGMGGFHGDVSWRRDPSTDNAAKSALRSVNVMRGIVAVYGADPSQWPEKVVRDTWQQVSDVARLKQAHANKQANAPKTPEYKGEKATMANLGLPQHAQRTEKVGTQREVATVDELRRVGGQMQSLGANESFGDRYFKDDPSTSGLLTELRDGYLNLPPAYHNNPRIRQGYQLAMGAVARYGANPAQWPPVVRGRVGKEVAGVHGLDQFIGRIRGDLHVNG